jgi:hypothetical protein
LLHTRDAIWSPDLRPECAPNAGAKVILKRKPTVVAVYRPIMRRVKARADVIITNRRAPELADVAHTVYKRDLFRVE